MYNESANPQRCFPSQTEIQNWCANSQEWFHLQTEIQNGGADPQQCFHLQTGMQCSYNFLQSGDKLHHYEESSMVTTREMNVHGAEEAKPLCPRLGDWITGVFSSWYSFQPLASLLVCKSQTNLIIGNVNVLNILKMNGSMWLNCKTMAKMLYRIEYFCGHTHVLLTFIQKIMKFV